MGILDSLFGGLAGKAADAQRTRTKTIDDAETKALSGSTPTPAPKPEPKPYDTSPVAGKPIPKEKQ